MFVYLLFARPGDGLTTLVCVCVCVFVCVCVCVCVCYYMCL
jgi:hypothetical protein